MDELIQFAGVSSIIFVSLAIIAGLVYGLAWAIDTLFKVNRIINHIEHLQSQINTVRADGNATYETLHKLRVLCGIRRRI